MRATKALPQFTERQQRRFWKHVDRKGYQAHRIAYALAVGPIREDQTIDHLCRKTSCVNPTHLEAVGMKENILRGTSFSAANAAKTHCAKGHEYTPENTILHPGDRGRRRCAACRVARQQKAK